MDFPDFLSLVRRQWITVMVVLISAILASTTLFFLQPPGKKLTLLFSVGVSEKSVSEKSFDATKLSDDFAKTMAGWIRGTTLSERVSGISGVNTTLSATPQAKQNFLVEANFGEGSENNISQATKQVLNEELEKYNLNSKFKFFTTLHGESISITGGSLEKTLAAATVGGILLAMICIVLNSYFGGKINSVREAERLLRIKAAVVFRNPKNEEVNFLKKLIKKSHHAVLIGANIKTEKLREKLNLGIKALDIPKDAEKIGKGELKIVVVKLGKSKVNTLRMLKPVYEENIKLVIWG